jgi:hypothetical protein
MAVEDVFTRVAPIVWLTVTGRRVGTTAEHPFYVVGVGWRCAGELTYGDVLSSHNAVVGAVETVHTDTEMVTVYNLRVAAFHTYFVGHPEWGFSIWAHNANYQIIPDAASGRYVLADSSGKPVIHPETGKPISGKTASDVFAKVKDKSPGELIPDAADIAIAPNSISASGLSIPSASELSALGSALDRGGLTNVGRSLTKHAAGARAGSTAFPKATGSPAKINAQAQQVLDGILNDPARVVKQRAGKPGEQLLQVSRADGTGVIFKWDGTKWVFSHLGEGLH